MQPLHLQNNIRYFLISVSLSFKVKPMLAQKKKKKKPWPSALFVVVSCNLYNLRSIHKSINKSGET